jgi:hypothetical protein
VHPTRAVFGYYLFAKQIEYTEVFVVQFAASLDSLSPVFGQEFTSDDVSPHRFEDGHGADNYRGIVFLQKTGLVILNHDTFCLLILNHNVSGAPICQQRTTVLIVILGQRGYDHVLHSTLRGIPEEKGSSFGEGAEDIGELTAIHNIRRGTHKGGSQF